MGVNNDEREWEGRKCEKNRYPPRSFSGVHGCAYGRRTCRIEHTRNQVQQTKCSPSDMARYCGFVVNQVAIHNKSNQWSWSINSGRVMVLTTLDHPFGCARPIPNTSDKFAKLSRIHSHPLRALAFRSERNAYVRQVHKYILRNLCEVLFKLDISVTFRCFYTKSLKQLQEFLQET